MRMGKSECLICPDPILNGVRVIGFIILILLLVLISIWFNIRKKTESKASIINRIVTNYLHCITASISFNTKYPKIVTNSMYPIQKVGIASDTFLSFDCLIEDLRLNFFNNSEYILKSFLSMFMPILFIGIFLMLFGTVKLIYKNSDFKRNSLMVVITVLFFLHPTLT